MRIAHALSYALIFSLLCFGAAQAQSTVTIGETKVLRIGDSGNANLLLTQNAALSQPATIQSLSFYVTTASGQLRLGIYDATGPHGGPGKLKAQTNAFKTVKGWNTANVTAPVLLMRANEVPGAGAKFRTGLRVLPPRSTAPVT